MVVYTDSLEPASENHIILNTKVFIKSNTLTQQLDQKNSFTKVKFMNCPSHTK